MTITIQSDRKDPWFWVILLLLAGFIALQCWKVYREERQYREWDRMGQQLKDL